MYAIYASYNWYILCLHIFHSCVLFLFLIDILKQIETLDIHPLAVEIYSVYFSSKMFDFHFSLFDLIIF